MDFWSWFQVGQRGVHPESRTSCPLRGLRARVRIELDYANLDSVQFSSWTVCSELGGRLDSVRLSSALAAPVSTWTVSLGIDTFEEPTRSCYPISCRTLPQWVSCFDMSILRF